MGTKISEIADQIDSSNLPAAKFVVEDNLTTKYVTGVQLQSFGGAGGAFIDVLRFRVTSRGDQSFAVPDYVPGQRFILNTHELPTTKPTSSDFGNPDAFNRAASTYYMWNDNGNIRFYNNTGSPFYLNLMRFGPAVTASGAGNSIQTGLRWESSNFDAASFSPPTAGDYWSKRSTVRKNETDQVMHVIFKYDVHMKNKLSKFTIFVDGTSILDTASVNDWSQDGNTHDTEYSNSVDFWVNPKSEYYIHVTRISPDDLMLDGLNVTEHRFS